MTGRPEIPEDTHAFRLVTGSPKIPVEANASPRVPMSRRGDLKIFPMQAGPVAALREVTLTIDPGEYVASRAPQAAEVPSSIHWMRRYHDVGLAPLRGARRLALSATKKPPSAQTDRLRIPAISFLRC